MSVIELDRTKIAVISQTETAISELREQYMGLAIAGPDDRKGYLAVSEARKDVKARRVKVEHARKALNEDALTYQRTVNAEAKRITAMLEPIETYLEQQEDGYKAALAAKFRQAEEARKAKLQARVDALNAVRGAVPLAVLEALTDEQFAAELSKATEADNARKAQEEAAAKAEADRQAEAERLRKEEEAKLAAERAKLEAERRKADEAAAAERAKQAEAQRKIDEERRKLEAEKARLEREEFERQAKVKAEQEAREKLAREQAEQARLEAERKEREAAEAARREAMKPDLQKLREYAAALEAVPIPSVTDAAVVGRLSQLIHQVEASCLVTEMWCDEQEAGA